MATKQHSSGKKTCKRVRSFSKRSDWAAWMNGAAPEWLCEREALQLAEAFDGFFPAWLIESEPWREINGARFRFIRQTMLGLTTEQCAAYLGVHRSTISRWEADDIDTPKAAFEALRLVSRTANSVVSDKHWDGWFINRKTGELVSPDLGKLAVTPAEINSIPRLHNELTMFRDEVTKKGERIAELEAENAMLRNSANSRQMAAELEAMRERICDLLSTFQTAEIFKFNQPAEELRRAS